MFSKDTMRSGVLLMYTIDVFFSNANYELMDTTNALLEPK